MKVCEGEWVVMNRLNIFDLFIRYKCFDAYHFCWFIFFGHYFTFFHLRWFFFSFRCYCFFICRLMWNVMNSQSIDSYKGKWLCFESEGVFSLREFYMKNIFASKNTVKSILNLCMCKMPISNHFIAKKNGSESAVSQRRRIQDIYHWCRFLTDISKC